MLRPRRGHIFIMVNKATSTNPTQEEKNYKKLFAHNHTFFHRLNPHSCPEAIKAPTYKKYRSELFINTTESVTISHLSDTLSDGLTA